MAESPQRPPSLTVLLGPQAGREFLLQRLECTLGSDAACDVCVPTPGVAAIHARLRLTAAGARLVPEPGASGLYRNDDPVTTESPLASGDVVWLGPPGEPGSVMLQSRLPADLDRFVAQLAAGATAVTEEGAPPLLVEATEAEPELVEAVEPELHAEPVAEPEPEHLEAADEGEATIALSASPFAATPAEPVLAVAAEAAPAPEVVEEVVDYAATVVDLPSPVTEPEHFEATLVDMAPLPDLTADAPARFAVEAPVAPPPVPIEEDIEEEVASGPDAEATVMLARPVPPPVAPPPGDEPDYAPTVNLKRMPAAAPAPPVAAPPEVAPPAPAPPKPAPPAAKPTAPAAPRPAARPDARPPRPAPPAAAPRPTPPAAPAPRRPAPVTARPAPAPAPVPVAPPPAPAAAPSKTGLFVGVGLAVVAAIGGFLWVAQRPSSPPATTLPAAPPAAPPTTVAAAPPTTLAPTVAEEVAEAAPTPAPAAPATAPPVSRPAAPTASRPTPTPARPVAAAKAPPAKAAPATAPPAPDPSQVRAQQLAGWLEKGQAALDGRQFEQAAAAYQEALKLEPGNARATSGVAQAEAGAAEARKRFVAGRSFFLAKPSGKAPAGFNTQDVTVANPDYSAKLHFEATPTSVHSGVAWQVKVFAENDGKKAIKLESLNAFVTVNGSRGSVPSALKARELPVGQRVLVAEVGGTWGEAVKSWSLDIVAATSREETLKGSLSWK